MNKPKNFIREKKQIFHHICTYKLNFPLDLYSKEKSKMKYSRAHTFLSIYNTYCSHRIILYGF